jgi:CHAT domain-containing protein
MSTAVKIVAGSWLACAGFLAMFAAACRADDTGVAIRLGAEQRIEIDVLVRGREGFDVRGPGLFIWRSTEGEFARALPTGDARINSASERPAVSLNAATRGEGDLAAYGAAFTGTTLEQLAGYRLIRGAALTTPVPNSVLLDGRITFRRPSGPDQPLPAVDFELLRGGKLLTTIRFSAGAARLDWAELELPAEFRQGLPPGEYQVRRIGGATVAFRISEHDDPIKHNLEHLRQAVGEDNASLFALAAATMLIGGGNGEGWKGPYLADALGVLERTAAAQRTPGIERLIAAISARLNQQPAPPSTARDQVGLPEIDAVRAALSAGQWSAAEAKLNDLESRDDSRIRRLALLYRAVLAAESSSADSTQAADLFHKAIAETATATDADADADLRRIRHNCGNFLSTLALDRLHNRSFQAAAGVAGPITDGLIAWMAARDQYAAALGGAERPDPATLASLAQLYMLLADILRSSDAEMSPETRRLMDAALAEGRKFAELAISSKDSLAAAAGRLSLAEAAFRQNDSGEFRRLVNDAREAYLHEGVLAGVESAERLLGLFEARSADDQNERRASALRHLTISQTLAEILRDEVPADSTGASRAGFLARRTYVCERMIGLLIDDGRAREALQIAEAAKARALNDVLASSRRSSETDSRNFATLLEDWPADVAALEYFLGSERAWLFVVNVKGNVTAHELRDSVGAKLKPEQLVAKVAGYVQSIKGTAKKMLARMETSPGYDHAWQNEAEWFRQVLLPDAALAELRKSRTVLVVPHHVLHYFPFAALVIQRDERLRRADEMVTPKFLIDEPFLIAYSPAIHVWRELRRLEAPRAEAVRAVGVSDFPGTHADLPGVKDDLRNLRSAFGNLVTEVAAESDAVQSAALNALAEPGLVLFATHGQNIADAPLKSNLVLMPDDSGDSRLLAAEIFDADVGADLVVLSACFSGLADRSPLASDDLFGIQRALLHSGARCVVSGLWDVFDTSGVELMNGYFRELAAGKNSPEALAAAQRKFLSKYRQANELAGEPFVHPYFWAVYTTVGDDRAGVVAEPKR